MTTDARPHRRAFLLVGDAKGNHMSGLERNQAHAEIIPSESANPNGRLP